MEALEEKLGYRFTNRAFLENALTHSSYANENKAKGLQSNERLEFLGDSVLGMVVADYLFRTHPGRPWCVRAAWWKWPSAWSWAPT